ncbi:MAG: PAS domain-containing protein [Anaeromyxobacter sp.]|nr:PAS domain-containing protein [Anaeromyxobacter sp.]MBL0275554.1 PAS domain-containing protein [Anaeromyxobacter sp.]
MGHTPLSAALKALRTELHGGPRADLGNDVTELAALLLERELRRFATVRDPAEQELLSSLPDAAAVVSKDGRVKACNAAFDALAAGGRAAGMTPLEVTRSAELAEAVKRALEGTARRLDLDLPRRSFSAQLTPLLRGEVLVLLRDTTEERRAAATRRDFVANASHELRTPVAAIRGAAETLLGGALEQPEAARHFVEMVHRQAERLSRLTQDLLDLSRLESRQWRFDVAPVDLATLARTAVELHAPAAQKKGLALGAEVPEGLCALGDPRALEQVVVNLVDNAVKYTLTGGVTLAAATRGEDVLLTVSDTGPGIEPHHLARLFERFYRVDPGRAREAGGTGLGLAIAKHLVQGMAGEITVSSGAAGTRFEVRLPGVPAGR